MYAHALAHARAQTKSHISVAVAADHQSSGIQKNNNNDDDADGSMIQPHPSR